MTCPVAVVYRASWPDQQIIRATLGTLKAAMQTKIERTALILVGPCTGRQKALTKAACMPAIMTGAFDPQSAKGQSMTNFRTPLRD